QLGGGEYKIADIPSEPFSTWTPCATWAITAVYEWDSNSGTDFKTLTPEQQYRFIPRSIAWTDGNLYSPSGVLETT
ncbi:hypothetical protein LAQ72_27930, partial [Escherichia coli]|nr:hypothetical protein [Escherichia coli]